MIWGYPPWLRKSPLLVAVAYVGTMLRSELSRALWCEPGERHQAFYICSARQPGATYDIPWPNEPMSHDFHEMSESSGDRSTHGTRWYPFPLVPVGRHRCWWFLSICWRSLRELGCMSQELGELGELGLGWGSPPSTGWLTACGSRPMTKGQGLNHLDIIARHSQT